MPGNLASLPFWIDGFDINLASNAGIANNDPIGTWKNKGTQGAANDVVQAAGASKPIFKTAAINGHAAILFTAVQHLDGALSAVAAQAARHIFAVINIPATGLGYFYVPRAAAPDAYGLFLAGDSTFIESNATTTNNTIPAAPPTGLAVVEYTFDGVTTNKPTFSINGVSKVVSNGSGVGVGAETAVAGTVIGGPGGVSGLPSYICEILAYDGVQSAGVATANITGLMAKWA